MRENHMETHHSDLPLIWNIPHQRNPFFTGREGVLTHLYDSLQMDHTAALTQPQGLSGLGGIGKTQTAIEYAYRYQHDYQAVLWARADSEDVLFSDFIFIAHVLNLPEKDEADQRQIVEAVMRWLRSHAGWLLILDNIEDLAVVAPFIPLAGRGHVLLTTRTRALGGIAERIEIEKMVPEVGALLLLRRAGLLSAQDLLDMALETDHNEAMSISRLVDGLPLALDQAGAYIKETACSLSDYILLYQTRSTDLLQVRGSLTTDYLHPVATTWSLSFEKITQAYPAAAELLDFFAFLYPDAIPEEIITDGASFLGSRLDPVATDPLQLDGAIKEILRYSLIQREAERQTLTIHRLVQTVLKGRMDENVQRQWGERTVRAVNEAFPGVEFTSWSRCQRCLPHAQVCATLIEQWGMEFTEATRLLNQTGYYLEERAQYSAAEQLYQHALSIRERTLKSDHPDLAKILNNLASLYHSQGKYEQAEPLLQRALLIREQVLGREHPEVAQSLNNLAVVYEKQGKFAQAEPLYQRALEIREQVLGPIHSGTAMSLNNVALFYEKRGNYQRAEPLYQRALAIREQVLGSKHPETAMSLHNLASLCKKQGKLEQAEFLYLRALAIYEEILEPDHPDTINSLNSLAGLYYTQGKYEQAEQMYKRVLAIREKVLGPEHPGAAVTLNNLAMLYTARGLYEQAEPLYLRSLALRERLFGPEHPNTATCLNNLGDLYKKQGKVQQAEPLYQRALVMREKSLGAEHPDTAQSLNNLGQLYKEQGHYEEAEALYQRALLIYEQALGAEHSITATICANLAALYHQQGKYEQAAPLCQRALAISEQTLGPEHPIVANNLNNLAAIYEKQGNIEQSEALYQRALTLQRCPEGLICDRLSA
jgi:tetratricopeptide (TPR) repeat protein